MRTSCQIVNTGADNIKRAGQSPARKDVDSGWQQLLELDVIEIIPVDLDLLTGIEDHKYPLVVVIDVVRTLDLEFTAVPESDDR